MSSSEQAPEPTMDEILASIRKIISDDEPGETAQPQETASEAVTPEAATPAASAPENDGLSGDLASALNTAQEPTKASDEILDLTQVVEQQVSVVTEVSPAPQADRPSVPPQGDVLQDALKGIGDENASSPDAALPSSEPVSEHNFSELLAEAGVQDTPGQAPETSDASMEPPSRDDLGTVLGQAGDAAESADSGPDSDASFSAGKFETLTEPPRSAAGMPEQGVESPPSIELPDMPLADVVADEEASGTMVDVPATETMKDGPADASMAEGSLQSEELTMKMPDLQPEALATEPEVSAEPESTEIEVSETEVVAATAMMGAQTEVAMSDEQDTSDMSASAEHGGKSLEDSVKDMLRPLLREWLDDNMERIVQDTVKDEVASGDFKPDSN